MNNTGISIAYDTDGAFRRETYMEYCLWRSNYKVLRRDRGGELFFLEIDKHLDPVERATRDGRRCAFVSRYPELNRRRIDHVPSLACLRHTYNWIITADWADNSSHDSSYSQRKLITVLHRCLHAIYTVNYGLYTVHNTYNTRNACISHCTPYNEQRTTYTGTVYCTTYNVRGKANNALV